MKVLHILGCPLDSGAGKAIRALHEALLRRGIDSRLLGRVEVTLPDELRATPIPLWDKLPVSLLNRCYLWWLKRRFGLIPGSFHPVSYGLSLHTMPQYAAADILHFQWANATTMGPALWRALARERRPVVWTLRDMWLFTGGCHFADDCRRYERGCGHCPKLGGFAESITSTDAAFKRAHIPSHSIFVAISSNIAARAIRAHALQSPDIRVIPNSNNLDELQLIEKIEAREALGLPNKSFVVAAGALDYSDVRKGGHILAHVLDHYRDQRDFHAIIFGSGVQKHLAPVSSNWTLFGKINSSKLLNQVYSAADVFLMPSLQESFGKVTVEAMASGTPVIAFRGTPADEIIQEGKTGWLVPHGDAQAFATALVHAHSVGPLALAGMGRTARNLAIERYSADTIAAKHEELYRELLASQQQ